MKTIPIISSWLILTSLVTAPLVWSDDDHEYGGKYSRQSTGVALVANPLYQTECGSCHMAYPPGLLPERSWLKLMAGLENHFDDSAELDAANHQTITDFLVNNSADKSNYRRSQKFANIDSGTNVPIRISETPYFIHEHNEIPARLVTGNQDVLSFSHCNSCHRKAEQGSYKERDIYIPGHGKWDD